MPAPINYTAGFVDPTQSMMQTLQMGNMLGQMGAQRDARAAAVDAEAATIQAGVQKAERDARIGAAWKAATENPSGGAFELLASLQPEDITEEVRKNVTALDSSIASKNLRDLGEVFAAFESGNTDMGIKIMQERADAYGTAGNTKKQKELQTLINTAKVGDKGAESVKVMLGLMMTPLPGGKDAIDSIVKFGEEQRAEKEALALKNTLPKGPAISAGAEKLVNDAVMAAVKANSLTGQYTTLANDFEKVITSAGAGAKLTELIYRTLGTEKDPTALRQEYLRMRNTAVLDMLPPGVASDKDIELALAAFPSDTSSPSNIAGFLRGMSKLQAFQAAVESAKAEWIQQNGTLGTANGTFMVADREVKPDTRFTDFIKMYIPNTSVLGGRGPTGATTGTPATEPVKTGGF